MKIYKLPSILTGLALALGSTISTAQNASISWTVHDITGDATDISKDGTVVTDGARNGGTSDRTVNGVVFESVANSGNLFDSLFANDNIGIRGVGTVVTDANYGNFLKQGQRSGRLGFSTPPRIEPTEVWTTIEFTNLTVGNSYQIQIWAMDVGNAADGVEGNSALVLGNGVSTGDPVQGTDAQILYEASDFGAGQYAIGVFVADATTQTVNVRQYNNLNSSPSAKNNDHFSNGWQIRDQGVDTTAPSPAPTIATLTPFESRVVVEASTTTTDQTGVEYQFVRRDGLGGSVTLTSAWQESTTFIDTGLSLSTEYSYTVNARDKTPTGYSTGESAEVAVTTLAEDTTAPVPDPMTFAVAPAPLSGSGYNAITMTADTATDAIYDVEYFFDETSGNPGGTDSGWQDSPTYVDTGLQANTTYTYTVQARDKADTPNTNTASSGESATTDLKGTATITWGTPTDIADDVNDVSLNGTLVEARTGGGSASTVNGVLFDTIDNVGDLMANVTNDDNIGSRGWGSVVTDNSYRNLLRYGQRAEDNDPGTDNFTTIEFFTLTPGNTYEIQIWTSDVSNSASTAQNKALVLGDGSATAPVQGSDPQIFEEAAEDGGGVGTAGQYCIGTFVADAPNQAFNVAKYTNLLTSPSIDSRHWCNAWQLRDLGVTGPDTSPPAWETSYPQVTDVTAAGATARGAIDEDGTAYYVVVADGAGAPSSAQVKAGQDSAGSAATASGSIALTATTEGTSAISGLADDTAYDVYFVAEDDEALPNIQTTPVKVDFSTDPLPVAGDPDSDTSTVVAADASVAADGSTTTMVTVTVKDGGGIAVQDEEVSLVDLNSIATTIDPATTVTTDAAGQAVFTVSSSMVGTAQFQATVTTFGNLIITQTASVEFTDVSAPSPNPMTFDIAPNKVSSRAITMTATTATDVSGVEYLFEETSGNPGGTDSGWQDSPTYTDTGLDANTTYSYTVTARDKSAAQNATDPSLVAFAVTDPTAIITWSAHDITNDVGDISNNGTLVDARAGATASQLVNGVVFESVANSGNLFDSLFANDVISQRGYGSLVTKLSYQTLLKFGQRSGRPNDSTPPKIASTQDWAAVTFTGLTVGNIYEIQIWSSDVGLSPDGVVQNSALVLGDGLGGAPVQGSDTQILLEVSDYGAGQFGIGTFVAVASTQSFNVQQYNNLNTTPSAKTTDHWSNGWQLRDLGPSATDFDLWAGNYPGLGVAGDDDDGDGLSNDKERIYGLDPTDPSSVSPYTTSFSAAAGTFSYSRRTQSLTGLDYAISYSTDLDNWFEDTGAIQSPGSPVNDVEIVGVQISTALLNEPKLFIRVGAEEPVPPAPAPRLSSSWGSGSEITLNFTEEMDATAATNTGNYSVDSGTVTVNGASLSGDGKTVTLTLGSLLGTGNSYDVTTSNLTGSGGEPLTGSSAAQFYTWDDEPTGIKVFMLIGQSNMVGYGYSENGNGDVPGAIGSLRYLANNNGTYPEYDYTSLLVDSDQPATSAWKTRSDVVVWWEQGVSGNLNGAEGFGPLGPPFRGGSTDWYGPEYAFGQVIGDFYDGPTEAPVLIIKAAWGGHSLGGNFRPPSAVADRGGVVGASYDEIFDNARTLLEGLAAKFPAAQYPEFDAVGYRYEIVGIGFHQGYTDRVAANLSPEYQENLPDFIQDVRGAFGKPDLPFVIASTGMATDFVETSPYPNYTEVEQAQLWVIGEPQPANVTSFDTRSFMEPSAESPRNQGFHWHGNARSYFRVGLGLGQEMENLLTP